MSWPARVTLGIIFVLLALFAMRQVASLDTGFHLTAGNSILAGEGWPDTDRFTFTVTDHDYVDTSWGYQVLLALIERAFGAPGMVLFHVLLLLATFALLFFTVRLSGDDHAGLLPLLFLGVLAGEMRYEVRPELLSYFFLALVLYLLHRHAEGRSTPLWLLPAIFLVWANCHSLFVLGWAALGCFVVGSWLRDRRIDRSLLGWVAASIGVGLINPYGWKGLVFPFTLSTRFAGNNVFAQGIGEFQSPFDLPVTAARPFFPWTPILAYLTLFAIVVLTLWPLLRGRRYFSFLLALPFLFLSAQMVRNVPLLVVVCLPGAVWGLASSRVLQRRARDARKVRLARQAIVALVALAAVLLGLRVYNDAYYVDARRADRFGLAWNRQALPMDATDYLKQADLGGRGLNHLNYGGWLMWASKEPVFIDGRLEVIGEEFFGYYRTALSSEGALESAVRRHEIGWIFFPFKVGRKLLQSLSSDPRWRLVYYDQMAAIFVRTEQFRAEMLHESVRALATPPAAPDLSDLPGLGRPRIGPLRHQLAGLVSRQSYPDASFGRGLFHYFRRSARRAAPYFAESVRESGGVYYEVYHNLGAALFLLGRDHGARECYRIVVAEVPGNENARERLEQLEQRLGTR